MAQDAFLLAVTRIERLEKAAAFPGWFAALVRTACSRRLRGARPDLAPGDRLADVTDADPGPDAEAIVEEQRAAVRGALEALGEGERMVVALHYLAGLSYAEVAEFIGISESAARKRAFAARNRMKELMELVAELKTDTPARGGVRDVVRLFAAIRHRRHAIVARLLAENPQLVGATEEWSWAEAVSVGLRNAEDGTPLIRAVESGNLRTVKMLLAAGAAVDGRCRCAGAETPLWTAVSLGHREIAERLLAAGADPNVRAFGDATALHAAAHNHPELIDILIAAGADPDRTDQRGRTPADWLGRRRIDTASARAREGFIETGIRALDLFAPIRCHSIQYWPPAVEQGQTVLLYELIGALAPAEAWFIGFAYGPYDHLSLQNASRQWSTPAHYRLAPDDLPDRERRSLFADALTELEHDPREKLVVCLPAPGFRHEITAALPRLAAHDSILTTIVLHPQTTDPAPAPDGVPEGYTSQVVLDATRANRRLYPAIWPQPTRTIAWPSPEHAHTAQLAQELLAAYQTLDPELAQPDPADLADPDLARRGQRLLRYLRQPFHVYQAFSSIPGQSTPVAETLREVNKRVSEHAGAPPPSQRDRHPPLR